jgi:hypothetical protein
VKPREQIVKIYTLMTNVSQPIFSTIIPINITQKAM